jgi:hypothetical protein
LTIDNLYEFAGAMGLDPLRLFSYNLRQFFSIVKGFRRQKAIEENYWRRIYGLMVMVNRDPKKPMPKIEDSWYIPIIDDETFNDLDENQNEMSNFEIKDKLLKAWRLN